MSEQLTERQYENEVKYIAREIMDECDNHEDRHDRLFETVDRHEWMTYSRYHLDILRHSNNSSAYFEDYGPLKAESAAQAFEKMAFAAFHADVSAALVELEAEEKAK